MAALMRRLVLVVGYACVGWHLGQALTLLRELGDYDPRPDVVGVEAQDPAPAAAPEGDD